MRNQKKKVRYWERINKKVKDEETERKEETRLKKRDGRRVEDGETEKTGRRDWKIIWKDKREIRDGRKGR
jgi:hypothetical protein